MCAILHFAPGSMMNKEQFFNCVYNNWHGYGLILKDGNGRLHLTKDFQPENVGTDPEKLYDLLNDNKDIERFLHVRHSTKGATDETNVQPFCVYHSSAREVYFMHNGTLNSFSDYSGKGKSDTLEFCEKVLQPALLRWDGENGKADYLDKVFLDLVVDTKWSAGSTGFFVSNDLPPQRIGAGWKLYEHPASANDSYGNIWVSNTMYFKELVRGPRFRAVEDQKKAEAARLAAERLQEQSSSSTSTAITKATTQSTQSSASREEQDKEWNNRFLNSDDHFYGYGSNSNHYSGAASTYKPVKKFDDTAVAKDPLVTRAARIVLDSWDIKDPNDLVSLSNVTYEEWIDILEEDVENGLWLTAALIDYIIVSYRELSLEMNKVRRKQLNAEKRLREVKKSKIQTIELAEEKKNVAA